MGVELLFILMLAMGAGEELNEIREEAVAALGDAGVGRKMLSL